MLKRCARSMRVIKTNRSPSKGLGPHTHQHGGRRCRTQALPQGIPLALHSRRTNVKRHPGAFPRGGENDEGNTGGCAKSRSQGAGTLSRSRVSAAGSAGLATTGSGLPAPGPERGLLPGRWGTLACPLHSHLPSLRQGNGHRVTPPSCTEESQVSPRRTLRCKATRHRAVTASRRTAPPVPLPFFNSMTL